ncbi:hypothetical protein MCOR27_004488 [Pyricularia oryzae]|uniref:Oxidation resistance protein 1 n=1 Tax=Pyricularia grisea TaxID=148305 RepID=A0ABQ8NHQ8_PYRGI|nr:hypothetical protein MCOR01_000999 [Pyricularia oryzae]KAI6297283.1 hypothetical protein MCOR33_006337 [Pyricularia grisea]KAH9430490.1 hypothetical protein MCOR02_010188 [Pyricularia oryzae]KAI6257969.1 hypothetical protein MCOR19_005634 [Pyricularia oryzae]KAI6273865.1 hypothetical protein MCOR26_006729 [Pyricularia oryzae]
MTSINSAMNYYHGSNSPPNSSGAATPTTTTSATSPGLFGGGLYSAFGGLMRRWSSEPEGGGQLGLEEDDRSHSNGNGVDGVYSSRRYRPPHHANTYPRVPSPLRPPPLEPLVLHGFRDDTPDSARLMTAPVAEEIRIMVPERLRIEEDWKLIYSLDQDGASLATLYEKCAPFRGRRGGFVLVVRDDEGGTFGAYLSESPHIAPHYFGTGECFLWRASMMSPLPPPPSADTTQLTGRATTIPSSPTATTRRAPPALIPIYDTDLETQGTSTYDIHADDDLDYTMDGRDQLTPPTKSSSPMPPQPPSPFIRFKAFPYSGVNEYYIYCEPHWLSVGGGDGKYGLWLDDSLEKGVSATCLTFGNEPLSDEGEKFGVLGVELWAIGAKD